jgi:uncharacterized membrane protein YeaQ/YmgE (transglycosylase-associated protein family)
VEIVWTVVVGFVVGLIAKFLVPGRDPGGFIITILLGIAGAFVGKWLAGVAGLAITSELGAFVASIVGAIIILIIYRAVFGRSAA